MKNKCLYFPKYIIFISLSLIVGCTSLQQKAQSNAMAGIEQQTGLKQIKVPDAKKLYFGKEHRGYNVLFHGETGNLWGRYAAQIAMGEIGREVGGILSFMTGSYSYGGSASGSILDRLLAKAIGQPLSITIMLRHNKDNAPRLDILSAYSNIKPQDTLQERSKVGTGAGKIYSNNAVFATRISSNINLMKRIKKMRQQYIRVDKDFVTLMWAGQKTDYSAMIRDNGDYAKMLNSFMDTLADIADAIPDNL